MTSGYVYGSYLNFQANLDPGKTKSRYQAKWRSQIPVRLDLGFHLTVAEDQYWRIKNTTDAGDENFLVNLVHIDDLDFQIKSTLRVDDFFWIYKAPVPIIGGRAPIGKNLSIRDTYVPVERNLDTSNPNSDRFTAPVLVARAAIVPTFIDFAEERLELGYDYGAVGGPEFKTEVVEVASGRETRNSLWHLPLGRWQLGDRMVADSEEDKLTEVSYLKSFHEARRGSYQGFRYKDWADYYARDQHIATGDGVRTEFQLRKAYRAGDAVTYRPIQKPVFGTVDLFVDGINVAVDPDHEWTVNHSKGVISHPEPLSEGAVLTANFEFDAPVRFESDAIGFSLQAYEPSSGDIMYRLESVFVKEIRLPLTLPWDIQPPQEIKKELDLGIIYDTKEEYSFATEKLAMRSGWELTKPNWDENEQVLNLGDRNYDREEVNKLLAYFWNTKGKHFNFILNIQKKKYRSSFNTDRLDLKFLALSNFDNDVLFSLPGTKIQIGEEIVLTVPNLPYFLTSTIVNFEISNYNLTRGSQVIAQNSFAFYGGSSSADSDTSIATKHQNFNDTPGFVASFAFTPVTIKNISNGYPLVVESIGFIDSIPVLSMFELRNIGPGNTDRYPLIGIPVLEDTGIEFDIKDPFSSDPDVSSFSISYANFNDVENSQLINIDDILICACNDKFAPQLWAYAVKKSGNTFELATTIVPTYDNRNNISSPISYRDSSRFYRLSFPTSRNNRFNPTSLFGKELASLWYKLYSSTPESDHHDVLINSIIPKSVIEPSLFNPQVIGKLKPYNRHFYYVENKSLWKAIDNKTREAFLTYNYNIDFRLSVTDSSNEDEYLVFRVTSDNTVFPHLPINNSNSFSYIIFAYVAKYKSEIKFTGSIELSLVNLNFNNEALSRIFIENCVCTKGIFVNKYGYLVDMINGGIINLKKSSPNFFQDKSLIITADKKGFGFYSSQQNRIGYLAVNRG